MTCSKCKETGIKNHANGKEFFYCKKCKEEILPEEDFPTEKGPITQREIDEIFKDFYWSNSGNYIRQYVTLEEFEQECLSISPHWSDKE